MPAMLLEKVGTAEDALREVAKLKTMITEAVDDGVRMALKAIKRGRHAAEDAIDDAKHTVKQQPLQAIGIVFAAGVLIGSALTLVATRRR